ncbi:usherin-like isoform X2 [Mya arenaria]|uniref:usherin-like isoform X2 n=1 Tax=Mya arenaria TaxID=6604 RepID=UPI0022E18166|nr:usherin-like isoform X2 [Mya arenaria]
MSVFVNGVGLGFSAAYTITLASQLREATDSWVRVGLTLSGTYQFLGRLQDFRFYEVTLTNREIAADYSGLFPVLRVQSSCRCPASHPRVKPLEVHYCIKNGEPDNTKDHELRLKGEAHPLQYVNDGDANSIWISDFMNQVNLVLDLGDEFQVFFVVLLFYSPLPMAVEIQRKPDNVSGQWLTWQQFASDCPLYFSAVNNGPLPTPTSTNCLKINQSPPDYSKGNITFNILNPEPVPRPGYNDFYDTPELYRFVQARQVRVRLQDHFFVGNERHRYYGIYEYSVIARCECHGHAATCNHTELPYQCNCLPESHTQGRQCGECMPLYNNKPFRRGTQTDAFDCQPCECYSHANECVYDPALDPFPDEHYTGGGGKCMSCQHNTEGRWCDRCIMGWYRPTGKSMYAEDVCSSCDCFPLGVKDLQMDCAKEGGQCECKQNVEGRRCDMCRPGFYNLTLDNPQGCQNCDCHPTGSQDGNVTCSTAEGQCVCKANVRGLKCDSCQYGFFHMTEDNLSGCEPCNCNPFGSTNQFCEPETGQCQCKQHVTSRQCNECEDGYYAFESGCLQCECNMMGSIPPGSCDKFTGQCPCKDNVEGLKCDTCKDETFGFGNLLDVGCQDCTCNPAGTVNGSMLCNKESGDCVCKSNVQGASCNQCKGNTWGLSLEHEEGCIPCECDPSGTQLGDQLSTENLACNQNTGQCSCLTNRIGQKCDDCLNGYYVSKEAGGGCMNCDCDAKGTLPLTNCNTKTGQCECRGGDSGVTGIQCNECLPGYYKFDGRQGSCSDCGCDLAGSLNYTCDPFDGQCVCKEFTWKRRCDRCVTGSSFLDASNPYGCSTAPDQQPRPTHEALSSTSLRLTWKGPDYPNGVIESYKVYRNDTLIFVLLGDERTVVDENLMPYRIYSYVVEATNAFGSVRSAPISFLTPAGSPYGVVVLNVSNIQAKSAAFSWNPPSIMNGPLLKYILYSTDNDTKTTHWQGQALRVTLQSLVPFTRYVFNVDTCTTGGCLVSEPVTFPTMSAVPEGMAPPVIMAVNNTALNISWEPPAFPNGIIIFYELWMQGAIGPDGLRNPPETRIFHPSGQYNPRPTKSPEENALTPPAREYILSGLVPFTLYEFQVLAENSAGKAASAWVSGRTGATDPLFTPAPIVVGISPFSLNISWYAPTDHQSRGIIISYRVYYYMKTDLMVNPFAPPSIWVQVYKGGPEKMFYVLSGLSPYSEHTVKTEACNAVGCVNSTESVGRTNQDYPEGLEKPLVDGLNSSAMTIIWSPPSFPNGPQPVYTVQKTIPALSYPPQVISGTRFPGGGYYLFPPETIPQNVDFTGIRFWFRTRNLNGLLLFAASEGRQDEFITLQFKQGRPWFLFDPEGCASFVYTTNDEGMRYNDNVWHELVAWRDENLAHISIDNFWEGTRETSCNKGTIIGPNTGVYVGGLPADFEVRRTSNDQRLKVIEYGFQGCIRDIQIMQQKYPVEVWKSLNWNEAIHNELAFLNWEGCPINLDKGIHFMGQGFARFPSTTSVIGQRKTIKISFRTQMHTGIIFFMHGGTGIYIYCAMVNGALHFEFANGILVGSVTFNRPDVNFCDSQWYHITLEKNEQQAMITVEDIGTEATGDPNVSLNVLTSSEFHIGGVPINSEAHKFIINNKVSVPMAAFGGCIRNLEFDVGRDLDFLVNSIEVSNVNMDGCPPYHQHEDQCKDDLITQVYNGTELDAVDNGLHSYTDYLYRVLATNNAGSGKSPWGYGRTKEGSPVGVTPPYEVKHYSGFLVKFKWLAPVSTSGLLTQFVIKAYNMDNVTIDPVEALITNTSKREGNMTGTIPYTTYNVHMLACTSGGCSESPDGLIIHTNEEAPENVPAPRGESGPNHIYVTWEPPLAPNGLLTGYFLYMDNTLVYQGGGHSLNITNELREYTSYVFYLKACTQVGCTQGPSATLSTAQLAPLYVKPPKLFSLGTSSVDVTWETPEQLNGVLERYILYLSTIPNLRGNAVYNSSDFFLDYTITELIAGKTYFISLAACTGGGCTVSKPSNITTAESAPSLVTPPTVTSPSPSQLHVEWTLPGLPNGEIVRFDLFHNERPVYSGLRMYYDIGGLLPYSLHAFRIVACTRKGCSSSVQVKARTMESQPEGFVTMEMEVDDARTISVKWTLPEKPNGNMFFDIYVEGMFYNDIEVWDYSTEFDRQSMHRSQTYNEWMVVGPLIPMSTYTVQVNASNTVGYILSNTLSADMPPGSPDGVKPPDLLSQTPTTITATWVPVGRENSMDAALYILQFREKTEGAIIEDIFGPTTSFTYTKENLVAYKEYDFRLVTENSNGMTQSDWVTATTRQDRPAGFRAPTVVGTGPRYIDIVWTLPITPNGILTEYQVYQNGQFWETTPSNTTLLRADKLMPYTYYTFVVEVCTEGGCTRSSPSTATRTLQDYPEKVPAPLAVSNTPASIDIHWQPPELPNGVISLYTLEKRLAGKVDITTIVSVAADSELRFVDQDRSISPFEEYEYRIIVSNGAGEGTSPWTSVTTMSSRPAGIMPPTIKILGPTVMNVSWQPPLQPNGIIEFYTIRLPEPSREIRNLTALSVIFNDLIAYTEYSVTVTACTSGGCTQSYPVNVRTHATVPEGQDPPEATPVSQSMISLVWHWPSKPNGPNIKFELSRKLLRQPLDPNVNTDNTVWERIYAGTELFYNDRGLPMFAMYRYRVTVYNDIGLLTSDPTPEVMTFGGFPRRAATVTATAISHQIVSVSWVTPSEVDLQGAVTQYKVVLHSPSSNHTQTLGPALDMTTFPDLTPNTQYTALVTITINGGAYITSDPVYVTTLDGAPEGIDTPTLSIVSESAIRVSWMAPKTPNGAITGYNIFNNGEKIETGLKMPGSYVLTGLRPYMVYEIRLEVCTVFDCVKSARVLGSTLEALPQSMAAPRVLPLDPHQITVMWQAPIQPNGIILRYDLWRRTIKQCSEIPVTTISPELTKCTYVQCGILQNLCGSTCYSGAKVCCDGVLHEARSGYQCCGREYASMASPNDICCGGVFFTYRQDHACCNGRYDLVRLGEICCPDNTEDRVAIGTGDACCGTVPYLMNGSQVCCNGKLYESHGGQCCGGSMVTKEMVCCGGPMEGQAYTPHEGMFCCGQAYIPEDSSLCCTSDTGHIKVHRYSSPADMISANEKCCGLELISKGLSCCNFVGYNPVFQFCADISSQNSGCGSGTVCSRTMKDTAFCDMCDFDPYTYMCGSITGYHSNIPTPAPRVPSDDCVVSVEKIYTGMNTDFLDDGLKPFSLYEYAVSVVNSAGTTQTDYTRIKSLQAPPEGLPTPNATLDPRQLYMIFLTWRPPLQPNGEILRFILVRDGIELYRGLDLAYTDDTTILPYRSYTYILTACTIAGCVDSPSITVATAQAAPEGVQPPRLQVVNSTALRVVWSPPDISNGIIHMYMVHFMGENLDMVYNTSELNIIINDLLPHRQYNVSVTACTEVACTNSSMVTILMPEAAPQGVFAPKVIVRSATSVDIYWTPPTQPNGIVTFYALVRVESKNEIRVFLGEDFHATDYSLVPGKTYMYFITVGTQAGNRSSETTSVTMPDNTPTGIPLPENVTVMSATEIFAEWRGIPPENGIIDQYRVLLNAGRDTAVDRGVGLETSVMITGLMPFTEYNVRVQACLMGVPNGCGTGPGVTVKTFEAAPANMPAPMVESTAPDVVNVYWDTPLHPNGVIRQYLVYYRLAGTNVELLINRVGHTEDKTYHIRHAGSDLSPYTQYEYKIVAGNSQGDVSSPWTLVRTKAAPPKGLTLPLITVTGAYSVQLRWVPPTQQNGEISMYKIMYKKVVNDPTIPDSIQTITVPGVTIHTSISGLQPFSEYKLMLQAFNSAGNISSTWTTFKTGESSPAGLGSFDIERMENGLAVILRWGPPVQPNGIITTYRIYVQESSVAVFQGLNREFELRRLEPFHEYSVQLEACTTAGCTYNFVQKFYTAETAPESQPSPMMGEVTATSAVITWTRPARANGRITVFEVYRKANARIQKRAISDPVVVHREFNTDADTFTYTDTNFQPFTEYQYSIKAVNSQGFTISPWQSLFTDQAPPGGVLPPQVTPVPNIIDSVVVTWATPDRPNGIIQSYSLQRNKSTPWSFTALEEKTFTDTGLYAFTFYSYTITACSGGGCTNSLPTVIRTKESAPLKVLSPTLFAENSTSIRASWQRPQILTGEISAYQLYKDGLVVYEGMDLQYTVTGLVPFRDYTFKLTACTTGGCTDSGEVTGSPQDDVPQGMAPPILNVMSSSAIEVTWKEPDFPNGEITSYDVRRNDRLVYTESVSISGTLRTTYTDYNLNPGMEYAYVVVARNRKGSVESLVSLARTWASSPSGLDPPSLSAVSATSMQVSWEVPANPNGVIKNYTIFRDGQMVYSGGPTQLNYIVPGLQFWTEYTFRVQACTDRGCSLSIGATGRTLPSRPEEQAPPSLLPLANQNGAHSGVLVEWDQPLKPNGLIGRFELYRREVINMPSGISYANMRMVYNGSSRSFTDRSSDLLPFTLYEYSVMGVNGVGKVSSLWSQVTTKEAPPDTVPAPLILETKPSSVKVQITPPTIPNGVVRYYNVLANDTLSSTGTSLEQTVGITVPLLPYKNYAITVQACTAGGCTTSPRVMVQTGSSRPSGQEPVKMLGVNMTVVRLGWQHPISPNGVIRRFSLHQRRACPPTPQPFQQPCNPGDPTSVYEGMYIEKVVPGLTPYTAYEFQIQSVNDAGASDFPVWIRVETTTDAPVYVKYPLLAKNGSLAVVDWSSSFVLNSRLQEYSIIMQDKIVYTGITSKHSIDRVNPLEKLLFTIKVLTDTGEAESPVIVFDPTASGNVGTTPALVGTTEMVTQEEQFFEEVWFIALMAVLGVLFLLVLLGCCIRHCGSSNTYIRERLPLQMRQQKQPFTFMIDPNTGSLVALESPDGRHDKSGYYSGSITNGMTNPAYTHPHKHKGQGSFGHSSDSLFDDDIEEDDDDYIWDKNPDSGLVSNYDSESLETPSYSVSKEHTVFTDTPL